MNMGRFMYRLSGFMKAFFHPSQWSFGQFLHLDYRAVFKLVGNVEDASSSAPLADARVFFLDTGLDRIRSRNPNRWIHLTGISDKSGNVAIDFEYSWGTLQKTVWPAAGTFEIRIELYGYQTNAQTFDIDKLPASGIEFKVDIGTVRLDRR